MEEWPPLGQRFLKEALLANRDRCVIVSRLGFPVKTRYGLIVSRSSELRSGFLLTWQALNLSSDRHFLRTA